MIDLDLRVDEHGRLVVLLHEFVGDYGEHSIYQQETMTQRDSRALAETILAYDTTFSEEDDTPRTETF